MQFLKKFKQLNNKDQLSYFLEMCNHPFEVQQQILKEILTINHSCEFAKKFDFSSIKTIKEYQRKIPVSVYDDYQNAIHKMQKGTENILFPGKTHHFVITSGTTGKNKLIPENESGAALKQLVGQLRNSRIISLFPEVLRGKIISMANSPNMSFTEANIPIGTASGLTTAGTDKNLLKLLAFPMEIKEIQNQKAADYVLMRFSIGEDVRAITGNNAGRIPQLIQLAQEYSDEIIRNIELGTISTQFDIPNTIRLKLAPFLTPNPGRAFELKKELENSSPFLPELYWKNLKLIKCWLAGSVGRYIDTLKPILETHPNDIVFFDAGYGASEGKFNIPLEPETPYGPVALFSAFYEFLPVGSENSNDFLLLHQLEDKKEYQLLITTYSGLYRYDIRDIVKVNGFTGNTPNIAFVSKTADIGNIAGEKLDAVLLQTACLETSRKFGLQLVHFCVVPEIDNLRYCFYVEIDEPGGNITHKHFADELEAYFYQNNIAYKIFRDQNLLHPIKVTFMKKGWQKVLYKERERNGLTRSQIKLPVVYKTPPLMEYAIK